MGNTESNERQENRKIYKITKVDFSSQEKDNQKASMFEFELHDYVTYKDYESKYINLLIGGELDKNYHDYEVGDYLSIDLNITSRESSSIFVINNDRKKVWGEEDPMPIRPVEKEHVIEKRDSNGTFIKFVCDTAEFFGEMAENRERYQASIVDARNSNYTNLRQTSYDMPPK